MSYAAREGDYRLSTTGRLLVYVEQNWQGNQLSFDDAELARTWLKQQEYEQVHEHYSGYTYWRKKRNMRR